MQIEKSEPQKISGLNESREAMMKLFKCASHKIRWYTPDLDFRISDTSEVYSRLSEFCRSNPKTNIQILIHDSQSIMRRGHQLIRLFQQLSSSIELRNTHPDFLKHQPASFIIIDDRHMFFRPLSSQWEGRLIFNNPLMVKNEAKFFKDTFEMSTPDSQVRSLGI